LHRATESPRPDHLAEIVFASNAVLAETTSGTIDGVERKVWSAQELERMTPLQQDAVFESSVVDSVDDAPPEFLERVRIRVQERILRTEAPDRR